MPDTSPKLFERVPRGLFGPLGDPYAELYWELLSNLYQYEFEREPFAVVRQVALEIAEHVIRVSPLWAVRRQELEALARDQDEDQNELSRDRSRKDPTACIGQSLGNDADEAVVLRVLARRLVTRLERSGWVHFQYRAGLGEIMSFHPYAARILETLLRIARDEQPVFQGYVHSIATLLEPKTFAQRPGLSLSEAKRHTLDLVRELKILERNIHLFTQRVLDQAASPAKVLEEGFEHYEHAVMANYHRLKTIDNVHRQRSVILDRLDGIERDQGVIEAAAEWYASQRGMGLSEARLEVLSDLTVLRSRFDSIPAIVEEIDARNSRFSGVALRKLRYLLRHDRRTEGQLQFIVEALSRADAPDVEVDLYRCELLSGNFLYTPPTERPKVKPQALVARSNTDVEKVRKEAADRMRRMFSRRRIEEFVDSMLGNKTEFPIHDLSIESDTDYVRLLYLASYGLDGSSSFGLRASGERIRTGPYGYPGGRIRRVRRRGVSSVADNSAKKA